MATAPIEIKQALKNATDNYKANGLGELDADIITTLLWQSVDDWASYYMNGGLYLTHGAASPNQIIKLIQPKVAACGVAVSGQEVAQHIAKYLREQGGAQQAGRADVFKTQTLAASIAEAERARKVQTQHFRFGIDELDAAFGGVHGGQMLSIFGNPSSNKTALVTNGIARWIAECGGKVLFFELDMGRNETIDRLISRRLQCPLWRLVELQDTAEYNNAKQEIIEFCDNGNRLEIIDKSDNAGNSWTVESVIEAIERKSPAVVCVDYLTLLKSEATKNKQVSDYEIANIAIEALYNAAITYGLIVITLSQMSMESRRIQAQGGSGGTAKGGGKVEERSDAVVELFRDTGTDATGKMTSDIIATVRKARNNDAGVGHSFRLEHNFGRFKAAADRVERIKKKQERLFDTVDYSRYF